MSYSYFGNTSAKESKLLLNIEAHLILLNELFKTATKDDVWKSDSALQFRYAKILEESNLLNTREMVLIAKNARTKVSFLKDLGLVDFDNLVITERGKELLDLLNNKKFEEKNEFLQIDLVSLFFLKYFFSYKKSSDIEDMFLKYLYVFKSLGGKLSNEQFYLLPLVSNYNEIEDFVSIIKNKDINLVETFSTFIQSNIKLQERKKVFLDDWAENSKITNLAPFKTSKGEGFIQFLPSILQIFIQIKNKTYRKDDIRNIFKKNIGTEKNYFRSLYLPTMLNDTKLAISSNTFIKLYKKLIKIIRTKTESELLNYFFDLIYTSRYFNNLSDYMAQNKYYLDLTGIFTFENNEVKVSEIFNVILKSSKYETILKQLSEIDIKTTSLNFLLEEPDIKDIFKSYGVVSSSDLNNYQYNQNKAKLENLLNTKFTKENILEIIPHFKTRNDDEIQKEVTVRATVPTIFEYIIAIAWYYIDNKNIDFILKAGLSLDTNMLPKSHAVGGSSDFEIKYDDHTLMIEVTLTESTNQRRAEMESVSRHLGNILLNLDDERKTKSYGIFIAPYLNNNVLNDFRIRRSCYWENDTKHIRGMNILPLDCDDIITIINSDKKYSELKEDFSMLLEKENDWGSRWYKNEVKAFIQGLSS